MTRITSMEMEDGINAASRSRRKRAPCRAISSLLLALLYVGSVCANTENASADQAVESAPTNISATLDPRWLPADTDKISIMDHAPGLLPYFNNAPVFGVPGTVTGDFWNRTQLTGDWGGTRTDWARHGVFIDVYTTSAYQDVTSGGLKTGDAFIQNVQTSLNIDSGRAGLWSGGVFHLTLQSRYGASPEDTFTGGASVPQYIGLVHPGPTLSHNTDATEYYLAQALSQHLSLVVGKISDIFIPDETMIGDSYKYYFANFNFNKNPMTVNFYNPSALAALAAWTPSDKFALAGGVLDPNSQADNFARHAFDKVNLYVMSLVSYRIGDLPGQFAPAYNWSNQRHVDLSSPYQTLAPAEIPEAVGGLIGGSRDGLPLNYRDRSSFVIANFTQYVYLSDDSSDVARQMRAGQVPRGIAVFGRAGYAPERTNPVTRDASLNVIAHGLLDARPYDSFGVGYYFNQISDDLKQSVVRLTAGTENVKNEKGTELFYDFAITPAIRFITSYQHIVDPLTARIAAHQDEANVLLLRMTIAW
ncbi:carbohydrate porin [Dyella sp. RRB7]|uniref:carbohydrate porin n=1 Tax=Dyella sp. RRB7 TaxID=2919502 RepID=UPI001FA94CC2|nr:carbohydrate porin [Dyella sp. RRB7]